MYMEGNFQNLCIDAKNAKAELCTLRVFFRYAFMTYFAVVMPLKTKCKCPQQEDLMAILALFRQKNEGVGFFWRGASIRENTVGVESQLEKCQSKSFRVITGIFPHVFTPLGAH